MGGSAWLLRVNGGSPLQVQGVARLGIEFLGSRCFVSSGSLSIGVVCAGGSFYHGGGLWVWTRSRDGAQAQWLARARSSSWFKGWSSMPSQWPCALLPHVEPPLRGSWSVLPAWFYPKSAPLVVLSNSVGFGWELALFFISCLLVQAMALAAPVSVRRFSMATDVWWFSCLWLSQLAFGLRSHPSTTWAYLSFLWWWGRQLCAGWA